MSGSYPHISRLIASPSITTTKCALKRRCVTSMLIRLALRSLRRAPQRAGGAAGSLESSAVGLGGLHSSENGFVSVSERPGMWRMCGGAGCQIYPSQSSLSHLMRLIMKAKGGTKSCCGGTGSVPSLMTSSYIILEGVSRGFLQMLAYCERSSSRSRITVLKAPQPRGSGGVKRFGRLPFVIRERSVCFSCAQFPAACSMFVSALVCFTFR